MRAATLAAAFFVVVSLLHVTSGQLAGAGTYNVEWLTPTDESNTSFFRGGMPLGNGDTQVLAWANVSSGGVSLYVSKQDAVASDTSQYKVALVTLALSPNPFASGAYFNQTLDLATGTVFVAAGGTSLATAAAVVSVWVDAHANVVYVAASTAAPTTFAATLTPVRPRGYAPYVAVWHLTPSASQPDVVVDPIPADFGSAGTLAVFHANSPSDFIRGGGIVNVTLAAQGLAAAVGTVPDLWLNRRFGLALDGGSSGGSDGCAVMRRMSPLTLTSTAPTRCATLRMSVLSSQGSASDGAWLADLAALVTAQPPTPPRVSHVAYWNSFWQRSFVDILPSNASSATSAAAAAAAGTLGAAATPPPGATLWLRASTLAQTLPDGAAVASWRNDASGGSTALTQGNASRLPTLLHSALSGTAGVRFSEARRTVLSDTAALLLGNGEASVFAVFRDDGSSGGGASGQAPCCSGVLSFPATWAGVSTVPATAGEAADDDGLGPPPSPTAPAILAMGDYSGSNLRAHASLRGRTVLVGVTYSSVGGAQLFVDGCAAASDPAARLAHDGPGVMVGSRGDDKFLRFFEGVLGEVLVYPHALNASDLAAVVAYFGSTWGELPLQRSCPAPPPDTFLVSQAAAVSRYMNAAQSRRVVTGAVHQPIKFNGLAWTSSAPGAASACNAPLGPDCREWGPDNWWQNTRLPYWPMIADGDWAEHDVVLDYFLRMVPLLQARSALLVPNATPGMLWMTETASVFGSYSEKDYATEKDRPAGLPVWLESNSYIYLDRFGDAPTGELGLMILDRFAYDLDEAALAARLPWIVGALDFVAFTFPARDAHGHVLIYPSQACETLWCPWPVSAAECVTGDAPTIAVVTRLLERVLAEVPPALVSPARRAQWAALLAAMPPLPASPDGTLLPAQSHGPKTHNSESVAMYSTHPARIFSAGRALAGGGAPLAPAIAAFFADPNAAGGGGNNGWHQGVMHAALLGLRNATAQRFVERATSLKPLPGYRFQFFSGEEGMGGEPAAEVFSNLQAGLQLALLQSAEDPQGTIVLLPGWPCDWDVAFRLRAPRNTTVDALWAGGRLVRLDVFPPDRAADVVVAPGC